MQTENSVLKKLVVPIMAITLLIVMVAWMAGAFDEKIKPGQRNNELAKNLEVLEAEAFTVVSVESNVYEPVPAGIEAKHNSIISSRILAKIEKVHARAGQQVNKGQLLIELENADLLSRESQANAALSSVKARLVEAENSLTRAKELNAKGILANADLEQAQANYDSLIAAKDSSEQALVEAETALSYAQVRSPIDGLIVDRFAEPGNTAQPGVQLLTLYNPETLRVEANIREQLAVSLKLGDSLKVFIPSLNKHLSAEIEEMVPAGNTASRTFLVKGRIQGEDLLPGMYAQLRVLVSRKASLLVPSDRVSALGQLNVLWVLDNGQVSRRFIRLGDFQENGMIEVISGLQEGDQVLPKQ